MFMLSIKVKNEPEAIKQHKEQLKVLTGYIQQEYPGLTTADLVLAYRLGVKCKLPGKNGEPLEMFAELNPRSIGKVLDAYEVFKRDELGRNPEKPKPIAGLLAEPIPSQADQDKSNAMLFRMAYQCAEQKREYSDHGNLIYNWLDSWGLIPFDKERKWAFMHKAQASIRSEEIGIGVQGNQQEHKNARALAEVLKLATDQQQIHMPLKDRITTRAKQIAFITLLNELIEFDTTADDFLEPVLTQPDNAEKSTETNADDSE